MLAGGCGGTIGTNTVTGACMESILHCVAELLVGCFSLMLHLLENL